MPVTSPSAPPGSAASSSAQRLLGLAPQDEVGGVVRVVEHLLVHEGRVRPADDA